MLLNSPIQVVFSAVNNCSFSCKSASLVDSSTKVQKTRFFKERSLKLSKLILNAPTPDLGISVTVYLKK